jgi:mannitol 2-dehydrogenase
MRMSCDNIQSNGEVAKRMLVAFAELRDPVLSNWMAENCSFPNSMVDRIIPATTDHPFSPPSGRALLG